MMKDLMKMHIKRPSAGIDSLLKDEDFIKSLLKKKIGIITNQSALTETYKPVANALVEKLGGAIKCLLTPEHGWSGFIGEGVKVNDGFDVALGLPILSLYGGQQKVQEFNFASGINTLIIDLQDVGLRCYTYTASCAKVLEACSGSPIEIIVCDRSNPLGSDQNGPLLDTRFRSFVGYLDVPFQHGQTMGQLLSNHNRGLGKKQAHLTVIPCQPVYQPYAYPWVPPSPNLSSWDAVLLYPALVLLEGTNVSEGRGTSLPFTCLGAPGLDSYCLVDFLNGIENSGIRARPLVFTPQTSKHTGKECHGAQIFIENYLQLDAFSLGIKSIHFLKENYGDFKWDKTTNQKETYFIDLLLGTDSVRLAIDQGLSPSQILKNFK